MEKHYNFKGLNFSYYQTHFEKTKADLIYENLQKEIIYLPHAATRFRFGDKIVPMPRRMATFSESNLTYSFSGKTFVGVPFTPELLKLKADADSHLEDNKTYNFAVVNLYENGSHSISRHQDNEKELDPTAPIVSYSFGCPRKMIFRCPQYKKVELILEHGSLLVMKPPTNQIWTHEIPKDANVKTSRLNVTFRRIQNQTNELEMKLV